MAGERVVLGRVGHTSMVRILWTAQAPPSVNDPELLEDLGARWEGEELVTYDMDELLERIEMHETGDYMIDND
ncbi:MAG: hypothetical protein ACRD0Q_03240 [Acidimicrobiales bacterium]